MIFARSRRSSVLLAASGAAVGVTFGLVAALVWWFEGSGPAALALGAGALIGVGLAAWAGWQLRVWPPCRLGFFRDRMVVVQGRVEQHALWDRVETASLAAPTDWSTDRWSEIRISDRLTVHLRRGKPIALRPADFGLEPSGCRDLVLTLRDDRVLRARLPEFDSALDLSERPVVSGELITPRL
ncbi:MAG TPA: hypothetical protein VNG93_00410 [Candidatus Dormibacteraeota bacterium]|nr:hypothetical protein [Candidatus Dormibacteraeota bacterium]